MTPQSASSTTKALVGMVLLVLLGAVCLAAGRWQLHRADERKALAAAIEAGRQAPAVRLDADHRTGPEWHPATATGQWLNRFTVLLDNRNFKGQAGLWVATPLQLQDHPGTALLVLRGWLARPLPPATLPDLLAAPGTVSVHGTLLQHVPRLFDLARLTGGAPAGLPTSWPAQGGEAPRVQNLPLDAYAQATGLDLLPVVLEQAPTQDAGLLQAWPGPSIDANQNINYALQWFSFSAIALGAAGVLAWRIARRHRFPPAPSDDHRP